jgi:glycine/D-amino acid oxidase-like deaminating enzyme
VIIGGAMVGSSVAWWTARNPEFKGKILVVERDPSYEFAATSHTNSCIRQQFGTEVNVRISRFGAEFIRKFRDFMADPEAPEIVLQDFGYLYLAGTDAQAGKLRAAHAVQTRLGCATRLYTPDEIAARWPFFEVGDVILGSHNPVDEGYFDGGTIFDWFRKKARAMGAEYVHNEVTGIDMEGGRVTGVRLASGETVGAGIVVNASGTRAARVARMVGLDLPIEPRRRFTYIFEAEDALPDVLPLTIDPSGVHMRQDGRLFMCGCPPEDDAAVDPTDFHDSPEIWEDKIWPALAARVPSFERIKVRQSWIGHYDFNTLDQNAILGPASGLPNFLFANGFSGHGLQQSPAVGRGLSELILHGEYRSLDLSPLGYDRVARAEKFTETAVI